MNKGRSALRADLARTLNKLESLGDHAVVIDEWGDAWQKSGYLGYWYRAYEADGQSAFIVAQRAGSVRVLDKGTS